MCSGPFLRDLPQKWALSAVVMEHTFSKNRLIKQGSVPEGVDLLTLLSQGTTNLDAVAAAPHLLHDLAWTTYPQSTRLAW